MNRMYQNETILQTTSIQNTIINSNPYNYFFFGKPHFFKDSYIVDCAFIFLWSIYLLIYLCILPLNKLCVFVVLRGTSQAQQNHDVTTAHRHKHNKISEKLIMYELSPVQMWRWRGATTITIAQLKSNNNKITQLTHRKIKLKLLKALIDWVDWLILESSLPRICLIQFVPYSCKCTFSNFFL